MKINRMWVNICRVPNEKNRVSPNKFLPLQGFYLTTPILEPYRFINLRFINLCLNHHKTGGAIVLVWKTTTINSRVPPKFHWKYGIVNIGTFAGQLQMFSLAACCLGLLCSTNVHGQVKAWLYALHRVALLGKNSNSLCRAALPSEKREASSSS